MAKDYDVIVLGSGLAGLATALAAKAKGLRPLVIEKADKIGGGSTNSYGLIWIGNNHLARAAGIADSRDDVLAYMRFVAGGEAVEANLLAYVDRAPEALRFFEAAGIRFELTRRGVDHYMGIAPGAKAEGRIVEAALISAYELGPWRERVRRSAVQPCYLTADEQIGWGGVTSVSNWDRTLVEERRRADMCGKGLGLICRFARALLSRDVDILTGVQVRDLVLERGRVGGVVTGTGDIKVRHGVMLATGGYESNPDLAGSFEKVPGWTSQVPRSLTGDGLILGSEAGGAVHVIRNNMTLLLGFFTSGPDQAVEPEFHSAGIVELCSPHTMVVNRQGRRFADESYFQAMIPALLHFDPRSHSYSNLPSFLIFDQTYASSFSFGGRPAGCEIPAWVDRAPDIGELGKRLGIDPKGLAETWRRFNGFAQTGRDLDFHRGELPWHLGRRDVPKGGNASLGALVAPPFYGLQLRPSSLPSAGLLVNASSQVLNHRRNPIAGLYAAGNAAAHTDYGAGFQAGYSLGSGMTFGYLAACHMAQSAPADAAA